MKISKKFYCTILFVVFVSFFFAAAFSVSAQVCPVQSGGVDCSASGEPGLSYCGGTCRTEPSPPAGAVSGQYNLNCGTCAWSCNTNNYPCTGCTVYQNNGTTSACDVFFRNSDRCTGVCTTCKNTYRECSDVCILISSIPTGSCRTAGGEEGSRDNCGNCVSAGPRTVTRQYSFPGREEEGFINIQGHIRAAGDIRTAGDIYLNSGKAIRINTDIARSEDFLNIGNYNDDASKNVQLRIHAPDTKISELVLNQGATDYWALSLRNGTRNFEIWRNNNGWGTTPVFAIGYSNGRVTIPNDLFVGNLQTNNIVSQAGTDVWLGRTTDRLRVQGQLQLANLSVAPTSPLSGALYYSTAAGNTGVRVYNGTIWEAVGGGVGAHDHSQYYLQTGDTRDLGVGGSGAFGGYTPDPTWRVSTPSLYVGNGVKGTIIRDGDISTDGCFGPVFAGTTATSYNGAQGGYIIANGLCGEGRHICSTAEILQSIRCSDSASPIRNRERNEVAAWIQDGPPGYLAPARDCQGWTSDNAAGVHYGRDWVFNSTTGGQGNLVTCNVPLPFACCE